jgi:C4-dicarboxylate-binding protein DctP
VVAEDTPKGWAAEEFARRANEELAGKIEVTVFPNSMLYNDDEAVRALEAGFIEMAAPATGKFMDTVPQVQILDEPCLYRSAELVHRVVDGEIGQELRALFEKQGLMVLAFWDNGFKHFTNSVRPLRKPEDFEGIKFRIMNSDVVEAQMKMLGATTVRSPFPETYRLLKQGAVEGQENTASNIFTKNFHKVQKYMTVSAHGYMGYAVVTSKKFWDGLDPYVRSTLQRIIREVTVEERSKAMEFNRAELARIKFYAEQTGKLEIVELSEAQKKALAGTLKPVHTKFPEQVPVEWIERISGM